MAIRIDDGAVLRMIMSQLETELSGGTYTVRHLADPINDAGNSPLVSVSSIDMIDVARDSPERDNHRSLMELTVIGVIDSGNGSNLAIGTVGATICAALAERNLVDGVALGGTLSEHIITIGSAKRRYEAVSVQNRVIMTVTCTFAESQVQRRSGSSIASYLS